MTITARPKINQLPEDYGKLVLQYLEPKEQEICARVNQKFRQTFFLHLFDTIFPADSPAKIGSATYEISPISDLTHCFRRLFVATGLIQLPIETADLLPKIGLSKHSVLKTEAELRAFSSDGQTVVTSKNSKFLEIRDVITGACKKILTGHETGISALAITSDGKTLISGSDGNEIRVWDIETGKCKKTLQGDKITLKGNPPCDINRTVSIAVALDGKSFFSRSRYGILQAWDTETGECKKTLMLNKDWGARHDGFDCRDIAMISGGKNLITFAPLKKCFFVLDVETGEEKQTLTTIPGWVNKFAIASDGKWLIVQHQKTTSFDDQKKDRSIVIYDLERNNIKDQLVGNSVDFTVTPDNAKVIAVFQDKTVQIYDIKTGSTTILFRVSFTPYWTATMLRVSSDGRSLIIMNKGNNVTIYDIQSGREHVHYLSKNSPNYLNIDSNRDTLLLNLCLKIEIWKTHPLLEDVMAASSKSATDIDRSSLINIIQSLKIIAERKNRPIQDLFSSAIQFVIGRIETLSPEIQQEIKEEVSRRSDPSVSVIKRVLSPKQTLAKSFCDCVEELPSEMQDLFYDMYRKKLLISLNRERSEEIKDGV